MMHAHTQIDATAIRCSFAFLFETTDPEAMTT